MTYSTFIHSGLVNPAKPNLVKENLSDTIDSVTLDVPLLVRLLELAREDIKSDVDLHSIVERMLKLKNNGTLTMSDYENIAHGSKNDNAELESILKLAGI